MGRNPNHEEGKGFFERINDWSKPGGSGAISGNDLD